MRPGPLLKLLDSVNKQTRYPDEILIVDGSLNEETKKVIANSGFDRLRYFMVDAKDRGLTKQRNFGIANVSGKSEIVCFLDDDTVLQPDYFAELLKTYQIYPDALGVGGYITNETHWQKVDENYKADRSEFYYDGWKRKDGSRFVLRKKLGLDSNLPPCFMPEYSHGRSVSFLPPSGKIYPAEQLMGGVSSFRKSVFEMLQFSAYFEGYGLYEDADFTLRLSNIGKLYLNTAATLDHFHDHSGRPNHYRYGKMVIENGWYVWRIKYPKPTLKARFKWNAIAFLLTAIRFSNIFTTRKRKEAFLEASGRTVGWFRILFK